VWLGSQLVGLPILAFAPTHFALKRVMPKAE
jgi:hypothetical protein